MTTMPSPATRGRARAVARPLPGRGGLRRARRRAGLLRGLRRRRADGPAAADVVDRPLAPLEGADPVPRAPLPRRHLRRARQRAVRPPARRRALPGRRVRRRRARRHGRDGHRARGARAALSCAARLGDAARRRASRARAGGGLHRPGRPARARPPGARDRRPLRRRSSTPTRAGRSTTSTTGSRTTSASSSSSSPQMFTEPHSTKQIEDCIGWALETDPETLADTTPGAGHVRARGLPRHRARASRCPVLVIHGDRDLIRPHAQGAALAEAHGRPARHARGRRPRAAGARPGQGQPAAARLRRAPPPAARAGRGAARGRKRALFVSSPIGLGHARRDVAIAQELRALHPDLEIDWLAQHPVTRVLEAEGERDPPRERAPGQRVRAHRVRVAPSTTCTASRPGGGWTRSSCANFMVFHDLVPRRAVRPVDRRRGVGARLLPAREPGAQARRLRVADRLRRLAADARRRRARGIPDRRLQRRDDRAHRPLPARCATARSSSATPTTSSTSASAPTCPTIRDWTERALRLRRLRHRLRRRPTDRERLRARARLRRRTSRCASSPSAAPASARPCCGA